MALRLSREDHSALPALVPVDDDGDADMDGKVSLLPVQLSHCMRHGCCAGAVP